MRPDPQDDSPFGAEGWPDWVLTSVPRAEATTSAGDLRRALVHGPFASVVDVAVCERGRFAGLVPIERLLVADESAPLGPLIDGRPTILAGAGIEAAAAEAAQHGARSAAVVDDDGRFLGLVPPERLLATAVHEHEQDMARMGGFLARSAAARTASLEAVGRRLGHRLPWLALGLAGAMASAGIVGSFEEQLRSEVLLAFFLPSVVYMADAVGTQTETVVIRGISVGIPMRAVAVRELLTGIIIGALLAVAFLVFAFAIYGNGRVAATVAIALFASASIATLVAMGLPFLLARGGHDPAFGSGPLATVIQDLLSIIVYFAVAVTLVE